MDGAGRLEVLTQAQLHKSRPLLEIVGVINLEVPSVPKMSAQAGLPPGLALPDLENVAVWPVAAWLLGRSTGFAARPSGRLAWSAPAGQHLHRVHSSECDNRKTNVGGRISRYWIEVVPAKCRLPATPR